MQLNITLVLKRAFVKLITTVVIEPTVIALANMTARHLTTHSLFLITLVILNRLAV